MTDQELESMLACREELQSKMGKCQEALFEIRTQIHQDPELVAARETLRKIEEKVTDKFASKKQQLEEEQFILEVRHRVCNLAMSRGRLMYPERVISFLIALLKNANVSRIDYVSNIWWVSREDRFAIFTIDPKLAYETYSSFEHILVDLDKYEMLNNSPQKDFDIIKECTIRKWEGHYSNISDVERLLYGTP